MLYIILLAIVGLTILTYFEFSTTNKLLKTLNELIKNQQKTTTVQERTESDDELFKMAKELVTKHGKASASLLQRRLRIGYARAARLIDLLEEEGIVGPVNGAEPREVI
jgi:DNA segregation ATPase FtsK/SpoIIIE, S-DNA-T family